MTRHNRPARIGIAAIISGGLLLGAPHGAGARNYCVCPGASLPPAVDATESSPSALRTASAERDDPFDCDRHPPHDPTPCAI